MKSMGQFAFILHPMDPSYVTRKYPYLRPVPARALEWIMRYAPPFKVSRITGVESEHGSAHGHFVVCPLTSRQINGMPEDLVVQKIISAGRLAERLGARVTGLGALTAVVGGGGEQVADALDIAVTTGNSYTVATAIEGTREAVEYMGYELDQINLGIIGATGSIGRVCAEIMADDVQRLSLVARDGTKLRALRDRILQKSGLSSAISTCVSEVLPSCDVVIAVSSASGTVIEPQYLKPGAVVCDVARPRDVSRRVVQTRDDVLVIEGGIVSVPGPVEFGLDFGVPEGTCMACMAETMILAMEERYENYTVGRHLTVPQVREIDELAKKHGFKLSGFRAFEREIPQEKLAQIRQRAMQVRR